MSINVHIFRYRAKMTEYLEYSNDKITREDRSKVYINNKLYYFERYTWGFEIELILKTKLNHVPRKDEWIVINEMQFKIKQVSHHFTKTGNKYVVIILDETVYEKTTDRDELIKNKKLLLDFQKAYFARLQMWLFKKGSKVNHGVYEFLGNKVQDIRTFFNLK